MLVKRSEKPVRNLGKYSQLQNYLDVSGFMV